MHSDTTADHDSREPTHAVRQVFVSGRQNSGNTVLKRILSKAPGCSWKGSEGLYFEHRLLLDQIKDLKMRSVQTVKVMRLKNPQLESEASEMLQRWYSEHREASSIQGYQQLIYWLVHRDGAHFWLEQATSYIFYIDEIFEHLDDVRMIYMLRNPFDLCASKRIRARMRDRLFGLMTAWNRGVIKAVQMQQKRPDQFRIVKYEDMVQQPEETIRSIFEFIGQPFSPDYLDIPHVNASEMPFKDDNTKRGLSAARVYYYMSNLPKSEIMAIQILAKRDLLDEFYPNLPHTAERLGLWAWIKAIIRITVSPLAYFWRKLLLLVIPRFARTGRIERLRHRVRLMFGS